jgi:hypothetical protein
MEEIVAFVVDDDEGRKIDHFDAPDRLHAEFGIFHALDLLDAVLSEIGRRAVGESEIKPPCVLHASRTIAARLLFSHLMRE